MSNNRSPGNSPSAKNPYNYRRSSSTENLHSAHSTNSDHSLQDDNTTNPIHTANQSDDEYQYVSDEHKQTPVKNTVDKPANTDSAPPTTSNNAITTEIKSDIAVQLSPSPAQQTSFPQSSPFRAQQSPFVQPLVAVPPPSTERSSYRRYRTFFTPQGPVNYKEEGILFKKFWNGTTQIKTREIQVFFFKNPPQKQITIQKDTQEIQQNGCTHINTQITKHIIATHHGRFVEEHDHWENTISR